MDGQSIVVVCETSNTQLLLTILGTVFAALFGAIAGAITANRLETKRERRAENRQLIKSLYEVANTRREALLWQHEDLRTKQKNEDFPQIVEAHGRAVSKAYANILFWEDVVRLQIGDDESTEPLLTALANMRNANVPVQRSWIELFDLTNQKLRAVFAQLLTLQKKQGDSCPLAKAWCDKIASEFADALKPPPF